MMYLFDSYAWVEYLSGSKAGRSVSELVESGKDIYTPTIVVAELKRKFLRESKDKNKGKVEDMLRFIKLNSLIVDLDLDTAEKAAEIVDEMSSKKGFGLADGIVLATARRLNAKVVTGDEHFRGLKDIVFIKE
ncbi:MAG: type II toxin-antitoxin system VapC family toxin [Candidatus Altiarchaeota archaeon]|nr:type II toxin-antitoxin system VapC family toxin [Candidatus Altiarchaeota archaeon]